MGFTHYWDMSRDISERNFKKLTKDMKLIEEFLKDSDKLDKLTGGMYKDVTLHFANGDGKTVLYDEEQFCFNGDGSKGLDHESMHIRLGANDSWTFCKTARKPYDLAVTLILMSLKYHIRSTKVSSDGNNEDWHSAFVVWEKVFPRRSVMFKFKKWKQNDKVFDGSLAIKSSKEVTKKLLEGEITL